MKQVYIVGAGGFGRELLCWLRDSPECGTAWEPVGYLDDDPAVADRNLPLPYVGAVGSFEGGGDRLIALGVGNSVPRKAIVETLRERGAAFLTFIHPTTIMGERVEIGEGSVICPRCTLTCDLSLGAFTFLNIGVAIGHDASVGDYSSLSSQTDLCGGVVLGEGVWLGSGARVIPGRKVGEWARVGAGAVVVRHVPPRVTVFGNPAKRLV